MSELVNEYADIFDLPDIKDRDAKSEQCSINVLPDTKPKWVKGRRTPYSEKEIIEGFITEYLNRDYIERSSSAWSAPVILIYRKGKPRLCIDFRLLNGCMVPEPFTGSFVWDILEKMGRSKYISITDLTKAYHQWAVHPDSRHFLAFSCSLGHFQFKVVPFGIMIAPAFFARQMSIALQGLTDTMNYFDDVCLG